MKVKKKSVLKKNGYIIGSISDLLDLTEEEVEYIEIKLALANQLTKIRKQKKMTQIELAKRLKSSQSRVAKMESGDPTVTIDLLIKSLFALGERKELLTTLFEH